MVGSLLSALVEVEELSGLSSSVLISVSLESLLDSETGSDSSIVSLDSCTIPSSSLTSVCSADMGF